MLNSKFKREPTRMNRKGSVLDLFYLAIILFIFAITSIIGYKIFDQYNTLTQANPDVSDISKDMVSTHFGRYPATFDSIFAFVFIGVGIALIVSAFMVRTHAIFFVFMMIIFGFFILINGVLANVYDDVASNSALEDIRDEFDLMEHMMRYFPFILLIISVVIAVVQYSKPFGGLE